MEYLFFALGIIYFLIAGAWIIGTAIIEFIATTVVAIYSYITGLK